MGAGEWLKRKLAMIALATANVEKNAFNDGGNSLSDNIGMERRLTQDRLSDALIRGEVTQEVQNLRWRMYKVLNQVSGSRVKFKGYDVDSEGSEIYKTEFVKASKAIKKMKLDESDPYKPDMIIWNEPIALSVSESMAPDGIEDRNETYIAEDGSEHRTIGVIDSESIQSQIKPMYSIMVNREFPPKINIENYTEKLVVRTINGDSKLLEFYISKYADETDRKSYLLISDIKKAMINPRATNILDLTGVGYLTTTTSLGVDDNCIFEYKIDGFHKIIEFGGYYVIKFKASVLVNGENMFDKYKVDDLEQKYKNKEKKGV